MGKDKLITSFGTKILAIGAHPDDIEVSCSGFLLKLKREHNCQLFSLICTGGGLKSAPQTRIAEQKRANRLLSIEKSFFLGFKDGHLSHGAALVTEIEKVINFIEPNLILSHGMNDSHQDHRAVSKATLSATRKSNSSILFYPSYLGREPFAANLYVDITKYFPEKLKILRLFDSRANRL